MAIYLKSMFNHYNTHKKNAESGARYDRLLAIAVIVLTFIGLLTVYNASVVSAFREFADPYYFVKDQVIFAGIGFLSMAILSRIPYRIWYNLSVPLLIISLILLIAVFLPGIGIKAQGAKRWINAGFFTIQPTEIAKFSLVVYLSAWFVNPERKRFTPFLILLGLIVGLVLLQPDMGTSIILILICIGMYFVSGAPVKHFLLLFPIIGIGLLLLAVMAPYRMARVTTFLNPDLDPQGSSYHVRQILLSLGSGGLVGQGVGKSRQKYEYLPEADTDSIFAILAEEVGFVGSMLFIGILVFIVWRSFIIVRHAPDRFSKLLACGIAVWFAGQTIINLGAMVVLFPLTGVPLPLVSYGGSSLVTMLSGFGILLQISHAKGKAV